MRIFYDHQVTSLQDAGGVSRYYFELVRALLALQDAEIGPRIQPELLLGWNRSVLPFAELAPAARVTSFATNIRPGYPRYALNEALSAAVVPLRGAFDVYHATYQRILPYPRAKAVVATHHDSTPDRYPALFSNAASIHARLAKVYARADRIICISESSRADLLHFFNVAADNTIVVPHGFTPLRLYDPEDAIATASDAPYIFYVGSRTAYKNFPALLQALARQPDTDLRLVAAGGGPWNAEETALIGRLRLGERVESLPRVTDAQLAWLYRDATLFVYPSLYEGFGFPPLEAMALGCPVLVSRTSALPEVCGDAAFYFDPASVDELATSIEQLISDESLRTSKTQAGFERVRQYTWRKAAAGTLAVYEDAIKAAASG